MEKVKVENVKTGVVKLVEKTVASDYIGTKDWKLATEKKEKYVVKEDKPL